MTETTQLRSVPHSDLDMNLMLTNSVWGNPEVSSDLREHLTKYYSDGSKDEDGNLNVTKRELWGLLSFYTRDIRLANLSRIDNELQTCRYFLNLAGDLLQVNMVEPFLISLSRAATILETSQSKGGFLRKMMNTLRQEHYKQEIEPPKKSMFGGQKKKGGEY